MSTQQITSEIRQWIASQAAAGCDTQQLLESMRSSGWEYQTAVRAIDEVLRTPQGPAVLTSDPGATAVATPSAAASALPGPGLADSPLDIDTGDRSVRVLMTLSNPRVVAFEHFMTDTECDELIELARPRMERSLTLDRDKGGSSVNAARSSMGMFFSRGEFALCARIEQRIARLLNWPIDHGEGLQVLRYGEGAQYKPHYDYFDLAQPDLPAILARGGQRVGTLVMYLNSTRRGGSTVFPDVGLEVAPIKGNAVFFSYDRPHPDTRSLHGGTPVVEGEKWIATKWLRQGVFA